MSLQDYVRKRDFRKTAEPRGGRAGAGDARKRGQKQEHGHRFVIQKHAASRLHYDFRLELGGTLKSWAVPKGVPYRKGERRLAVHVEDHPVGYIDFEGTIPQGQYGGGTVMVWDAGTYEPLSATPAKDLAGGKLHFVLRGKKLRGEWYLVRLRGGDEWLLIKGGEDLKPVSAKADDTSVRSGKSMAELAQGKGRVWQSQPVEKNSFKAEIAEAVAKAAKKSTKKSTVRGKAVDNRKGAAEPVGTALRAVRGRSEQANGKRGPLGARSLPAAAQGAAKRGERTAPPTERKGHRGSAGTLAPKFIEPMQAQLVAEPPPGEWGYEIKFDGFRAVALRDRRGTRLLSRNEKDFAAKFPDVVAAVDALDLSDAVIDGEIVALDPKGRSSFQLLQAYELGQERPPLFFYAFDLLQLNGEDLRARPLAERKAALETLLARTSHGAAASLPPSTHEGRRGRRRGGAHRGGAVRDEGKRSGLMGATGVIRFSATLGSDADALLEQARKLGLEGLIGKRLDSVYEAGRRSGAWIKLKLHREQEFVIGGYTPPGGGRTHFGALLIGYYEEGKLRFAGKVGTGFDAARLRDLHARFRKIAGETCPFPELPEARRGRYGAGVTAAEMKRCHWVKPRLVAQVKFAEWTRDERLRQPVFLGLREDKAAKDVGREKAE